MEKLFEKHHKKLGATPNAFKRYLLDDIDWSQRLIGIKGARGVGKTTLLFQHLRSLPAANTSALYVSLDDIYFTENRLVDLADTFVKNGGELLVLDEVHRYPTWSQEIKNLYDDHHDLKIIFTGSSAIHLEKAKADLSRRAIVYELHGLSFREYVGISTGLTLPHHELGSILQNHTSIAAEISDKIKPILLFKEYLQHGYYPFFLESKPLYPDRLMSTILLALDTDLPAFHEITSSSIAKIKLLLYVLAESVPFKPNITKISEKVGVTRNSLISFLQFLEELRVIKKLYASTRGVSSMQKPEKLYLYHPNLHFALAPDNANLGNLRESFFMNQLGVRNRIAYSEYGDFLVNEKLVFEVGGKDKSKKQLPSHKEAYVAADNLEIGSGLKIPLWLFGFLY